MPASSWQWRGPARLSPRAAGSDTGAQATVAKRSAESPFRADDRSVRQRRFGKIPRGFGSVPAPPPDEIAPNAPGSPFAFPPPERFHEDPDESERIRCLAETGCAYGNWVLLRRGTFPGPLYTSDAADDLTPYHLGEMIGSLPKNIET